MVRGRMRLRIDSRGRIHQIEFDDGAMDPDEDEVCDVVFIPTAPYQAPEFIYERIIEIWPDDTWEDITAQFDHGTWIETQQTLDDQFEQKIDRNTERELVRDTVDEGR